MSAKFVRGPGYRDFYAAWVDGTFKQKFPRPDDHEKRQQWNKKVRRAADWAGCPEMLSVIRHAPGGSLPQSYEGKTLRYQVTSGGGSKSTVGFFCPTRSLGLGHGDTLEVYFGSGSIIIKRAAT